MGRPVSVCESHMRVRLVHRMESWLASAAVKDFVQSSSLYALVRRTLHIGG